MSALRLLGLLVAIGALWVAPARAATTCVYNGAKTILTITNSAQGDTALLYRNPGAPAQLAVNNATGVLACTNGPGTVTGVDSISYIDTSGSSTTLIVNESLGTFGPGATSEGMFNISEIEITAAFGNGDYDTLYVAGTADADQVRLGAPTAGKVGINLNTSELTDDGDDIASTGLERVTISSAEGADVVSAAGGAGTGAVLPGGVYLVGGPGDDVLTGGDGPDYLFGGAGDDALTGGASDDELGGDADDDQIDGGPGRDTHSYYSAEQGVVVDLGIAGAQETGQGTDALTSIESLEGTELDDVLRGTDGAEELEGLGGDDLLEGRGGDDLLLGGGDDDVASYAAAPGPVTVDLAAAAPQAGGAAGADELKDIESLTGSAFADVLSGNDAANELTGGGGADHLLARGGDDTLRLRDGVADTADCGDGQDTAQVDAVGVDALTACETVDVSATTVQPDPGPSPGGGTDPGADPGPGANPGAAVVPACLKSLRPRLLLDRRLRTARVTLGGKRLATSRVKRRLTVRVDLRAKKTGVYRVKVDGRTATGKRLRSTRRLRVCG
ncbi:MAG: calcium-binding protein [Solirubrobacteraceae bacterium]